MSVLKWKKKIDEWADMYKTLISNCLKKDQNLADLNDKATARDNIGLSGDNNTTHQHDSIYMPMINKEATERKATDEEILNEIEILKNREDSSLKDLIQTLVNNEASANQQISSLTNQISNTENRLNSDINNLVNQTALSSHTISVPGSSMGGQYFVSALSDWESEHYIPWEDHEHWYTFYINGGIGAGTYNLVDLLTALVKMSHTHTKENS